MRPEYFEHARRMLSHLEAQERERSRLAELREQVNEAASIDNILEIISRLSDITGELGC